MAVFRVEKTKDFTVMSNHHLRNVSLSLKAKGLLSLMLSLPDNWDYYRLVNRKFVRLLRKHSHHAHFMGLPAYRLHIPPLGRFRGRDKPSFTVTLCRLLRASYNLAVAAASHVAVLKRTFPGVTPSFHPLP